MNFVLKHSLGQKIILDPLIVVVYALQTQDYDYFDIFYPSRRLAEAAKNRSISLRFLFPHDVPSFLNEISCTRTPENTLFFLRGAVSEETILHIEKSGFRCINHSYAVRIANDKQETALFLQANGYPTPRILAQKESTGEICFPVIAKPRFGSRGRGVCLAHCPEDIPKGDFLIQEYIAPSHGRDYRVFFAGGSILAAIERRSGDTMGTGDRALKKTLISNINTGGSVFLSPFTPAVPENIASMVLEIAKKTGLWYGTVDFLFCSDPPDPHRMTICEINAFPGFTALEQEGGFDIAGALIEKLSALFFAE